MYSSEGGLLPGTVERLGKVGGQEIQRFTFLFRHGHGKMIYKDKRVYEGEWSRDRRHGFGTLTYPGTRGKVGVSRHPDLQDGADLC